MTDAKRFYLIAGLGNPGAAYAKTRHNAGFMVVDALADTFAIPVGKKMADAVMGRGRIKGTEVILAKPMAFMNRSGPPIKNIATYFRILGEDMLIIHDDIDLPFGRMKIKEKGGHGGHNGVRSLTDAFGGGDFARVRIGIGRSEADENRVTDHVLGRFDQEESNHLDTVISAARDAVVTILCKGAKEGMNRFNSKSRII